MSRGGVKRREKVVTAASLVVSILPPTHLIPFKGK